MKVVLISTYELGRQPFSLASAAAWLRSAGHETVCADLSVGVLPPAALGQAGLVAFHLPMHTATRLALKAIDQVRELNPEARLCAFGLYAPMNESLLRARGVSAIIGGEFEAALAALASGHGSPDPETVVPLDRLQFAVPDRAGLPSPSRYAKLVMPGGEERLTGSTEASRGCRHLCRHCPVVPVYQGTFRVVQASVVLADIRNQVEQGAAHITFGDPDFFNGPAHAARIVQALHREFPTVTYDATIKVEHLLQHRALLPLLRDTGCAFITSAVESVDDAVLRNLDKGHTRADFYEAARLLREIGLALNPTFIAFMPWTTRESYADLLRAITELDLVHQVSPVQLALRLLITANSRLLELNDIRAVAAPFDPVSLAHPWRHRDPQMDLFAKSVLHLVNVEQQSGAPRAAIFQKLWKLATGAQPLPDDFSLLPRTAIPYLNEPWYC
jgi:radical SAM superfamily enzyme YgiQ (UPF0313 family)